MVGGGPSLSIGIGIASETGLRRRNEDFVGAARPSPLTADRFGHALALADGMGGAKGGREAAETAVRGFLDGYYDKPESWGVRRAASSVLEALNGWIHAIGRGGDLTGMGCTFTGLVLRGRTAHVLHIGDSRLYRFGQGRLSRLTQDHCLDQPGLSHVLYRAMGLEEGLRLDYAWQLASALAEAADGTTMFPTDTASDTKQLEWLLVEAWAWPGAPYYEQIADAIARKPGDAPRVADENN